MTSHSITATEDNTTVKKLREQFADDMVEVSIFRDEVTVRIRASAVIPICRFLKDEESLQYNFLIDVTSVDYPDRAERFDVVYHLYSLSNNDRLRLKTGVGGDQPSIDSVTSVWKTANWLEREVFDLMGIHFKGHPDLRRIVLPDDWEGHPLRKDYPLKGPNSDGTPQEVEHYG
ncbi:MAG: NADH-quinone oxidoreductase subunit C [Deltaproteobacteria bacterium]|nr:NADH-quinone oxidoreductase subunit C [Deltaproteobacteria bacterium]MBW2308633.1 NADH-quinone oxidoreductase subunit C [Deltaproteobacteria bacterium]